MEYRNKEYDFIYRTKEILNQYEDIFKNSTRKCKYDVTLLINCCVGLLVVPKENYFNNLPTQIVSKQDWAINPDEIKVIKRKDKTIEKGVKLIDEEKTVQLVVKHLRNSISHFNLTFDKDDNDEINHVRFQDFINENKIDKYKTFDLTLSVTDLRIFLDKLVAWVLSNMNILTSNI